MVNTLTLETNVFESICQLVIGSDITTNVSRIEWISDLYYMHKRGWLYCSMRGSRLAAVMGAFRISEWKPEYLAHMPEKEEGKVLYLPFIASTEEKFIAPLRLIRYCLKENPDIDEIIYVKKRWNPSPQKSFILKRWTRSLMRPQSFHFTESGLTPIC